MTKTNAPPEIIPPEMMVELGRLNGLSDGVFSIALTLLVLDVRLPEGILAGDLTLKLVELVPKLLIYLISFIVIGGAWGSHQRMLSQIRRGDGLLVWFNLLSLLFVTLLPASSAILGRFPETFAAILLFAVDVILIQVTALWVWRHASRSGLINPLLDPRVVVSVGRRLVLSAAAFGLSIPLAYFNPQVGYLLWIALFILIFTTDWLSWQLAQESQQSTIPLNNAQRGQLTVSHSAGHLHVQPGVNNALLVEGSFGGGLDSTVTQDGDLIDARLSMPKRQGLLSWRYPWSWGLGTVLDWNLSLNREIALALKIETGAGQVELDLAELLVSDLIFETTATSAIMSLPEHAGSTHVKIEASSASLVILIPESVAAHIQVEKALSTLEVDVNRFILIQDGREYRSADYATAANRVEIELELALGSTKIVTTGGQV